MPTQYVGIKCSYRSIRYAGGSREEVFLNQKVMMIIECGCNYSSNDGEVSCEKLRPEISVVQFCCFPKNTWGL